MLVEIEDSNIVVEIDDILQIRIVAESWNGFSYKAMIVCNKGNTIQRYYKTIEEAQACIKNWWKKISAAISNSFISNS